MLIKSLDTELNPQQLQAVTQTEGPLLVLAGAGTGKTRVLTSRVANIINTGLARPHEVLAVTFTNKAAREMQERIARLCEHAYSIAVGTFHSIAAKILRQYAPLVGLNHNFNILDADDQLKIIKTILIDLSIDIKETAPKHILAIISRWKDMGLSYGQVSPGDLKSETHKIAKKVYELYQNKLLSSNLCDFGDLLLYNTILFFQHAHILETLQNQYKYVLIDEYQDTNAVQYLWARMLADKHKNICCVGDDDQSIYSWRGAEVANILRFEKDFPGAIIIALEQNYRSTTHILKSASSLIKNNSMRHSKSLWTSSESGEPIKLVSCYNDKEEARFIASNIYNTLSSDKLRASEIAVLVRAGFQTRAFEEAFITLGIPYRIIGGLKFYERAEIKDIIAYLRLILNHRDDIAFERIINTPKRAIGPSTLLSIKNFATDANYSYLEASYKMLEQKLFKPKLLEAINNFVLLIKNFESEIKKPHLPADIVKNLLQESGYKDMLRLEKTEESRARQDNLNELVKAISEYDSIEEFIQHTSLVMENDASSSPAGEVNIMTLHAAKGLEFDTVFIPGMEEGLMPHQKSLNEEGALGLEEERRLAYVGITRAKRNLFLLYAESRRIFNEFVQSIPSRFLSELPLDSIVKTTSTGFVANSLYSTSSLASEKETEKITDMDPIRPGARVSHTSFGSGIIIKKNADNLEIYFDSCGIKTIKQSFIKLKP